MRHYTTFSNSSSSWGLFTHVNKEGASHTRNVLVRQGSKWKTNLCLLVHWTERSGRLRQSGTRHIEVGRAKRTEGLDMKQARHTSNKHGNVGTECNICISLETILANSTSQSLGLVILNERLWWHSLNCLFFSSYKLMFNERQIL